MIYPQSFLNSHRFTGLFCGVCVNIRKLSQPRQQRQLRVSSAEAAALLSPSHPLSVSNPRLLLAQLAPSVGDHPENSLHLSTASENKPLFVREIRPDSEPSRSVQLVFAGPDETVEQTVSVRVRHNNQRQRRGAAGGGAELAARLGCGAAERHSGAAALKGKNQGAAGGLSTVKGSRDPQRSTI